MDPQRSSTSKNQAHLNTGASSSKLEKELKELLGLAKDLKDETVFQQEHRYKKFKAKNHTIQNFGFCFWFKFFSKLAGLKFYKECIYWCNKILEDVRLCDSHERSAAICLIVTSFNGLNDYENAFKYGEKYLEISLQAMTPEDRCSRNYLLSLMQKASMKLNRIDEFRYPKEILKLNVERYNAKEIDKLELLESYDKCIEMQTKIGDFRSAKKTLKHLKLFSLNSVNSNDAIKAIEDEDYGKAFPLNDLLNDSEVKDMKKLASEFRTLDHDNFQLLQNKIRLYRCISILCWKKHEILLNLCEIPMEWRFEWGYLALNILLDINSHLELLVETLREASVEIAVKASKFNESVVTNITGISLLLADQDQMNRQKLFSRMTKCYGGLWHMSLFISHAQRKFSNLDVQKVMPFLEFCFRSLNEGATSHELNVSKVELSTFKNSLTIMNHFGALKNTLAFQPIVPNDHHIVTETECQGEC